MYIRSIYIYIQIGELTPNIVVDDHYRLRVRIGDEFTCFTIYRLVYLLTYYNSLDLDLDLNLDLPILDTYQVGTAKKRKRAGVSVYGRGFD